MTRIEYELLRVGRPELKLPRWDWLKETTPMFLGLVASLSRDEIISKRTSWLLCHHDAQKVE